MPIPDTRCHNILNAHSRTFEKDGCGGDMEPVSSIGGATIAMRCKRCGYVEPSDGKLKLTIAEKTPGS